MTARQKKIQKKYVIQEKCEGYSSKYGKRDKENIEKPQKGKGDETEMTARGNKARKASNGL